MPKPVSQQHPELMHYTTLTGLRGIVSSGHFWATDASCLNDSSEITHFFDTRLEPLIRAEAYRYVIELARDPATLARMLKDGGIDKLVEVETLAWSSRIRLATTGMNKPYIVSLSGPSDERIRTSGLLSQWRGYGNDGGYAIVLDTKKFEEALGVEAETFRHMHVQLGDVYYHGIDPSLQPATPDITEFEEVVKTGVSRLVRGGAGEETPRFYDAITSLSCLCKHWGFWEEREVRAVVVPASDEVIAAAGEPAPLLKVEKAFQRDQTRVPYIELFESRLSEVKGPALPIKRVIVGPHRDRTAHAEVVRELLLSHGYVAEVYESQIPYIGR